MEKEDTLHSAGSPEAASPGAGPDLEIRGPRSSRPLDKWRGGGGGGGVQKNFFRPSGLSLV